MNDDNKVVPFGKRAEPETQLQNAVRTLTEDLPGLHALSGARAEWHAGMLQAYIDKGFTRSEALELVKANITQK